jgi:hypothetical protein
MSVVDKGKIAGLYIGGRGEFAKAAEHSQKLNITEVDKPLERVVVYLDPSKHDKTWTANKGVYRTRMAMAEGGELIIIAPGVNGFGENPTDDRLIRRHGYRDIDAVKAAVESDPELQDNLGVAAHLVHGYGGRFDILYVGTKLNRHDVEGVGYHYAEKIDWLPAEFDISNPEAMKAIEAGHYKGTIGRFHYFPDPGAILLRRAA